MARSFSLLLFLVLVTIGPGPLSAGDDPPDIILIMADDVGIEGLGCYGGQSYRTPNLDQMAADGVRFTHAYSQPLCTPTRIELMTGKDNHRNWQSFGILDPGQRTFAHAMSDAGYVTGIFGKWQLHSYDPPEFAGGSARRGTGMHPKDAGFDQYALFHALHTEDKGSRYANPTMLEGTAGAPGTLQIYHDRYGEDVWVEKILQFLDTHSDRPRFVYYPMALPHWPFQPTPKTTGWDPSVPQETDLKFAGDMIEYMDVAVGNLMQGLRDRDLAAGTVVIFYSDNGTHLEVHSMLRDGRVIQGGKAMPTQTGIHVPLIVHCPDRFQPAVVDRIVDPSDFYPTLLDLAGRPDLAKQASLDGISFLPQLRGESGPTRETAFFWYDPRPGWDKERFGRHVFALNRTHKLFRDGRLFRLTDKPLEEIAVSAADETEADRAASKQLRAVIDDAMEGVEEPPLVDAFGNPIDP
ncbi:sulfatase-like hydrolase/transferase [Roseiconus nitratireducens]|uniref:Sulfatase-like hydrolase/transferase n=1 Tax=Roseiconus nitratireducens TaxID=2605748 RepID=A0A5M6D216_9BACT|nr:sulfatase-like hydrolase/transferase [Roseiconus nitratireducens]KAA5541046.1 sulfatase-like hydrolase/transferase [Roseiconus nitratireducens]